jgi:murein DD-endopeptidase / murein LD-carboxypeptidase
MIKKYKIYVLILSAILLASCQSAVRFTSNDDYGSDSKSEARRDKVSSSKTVRKSTGNNYNISLNEKQKSIIKEAEKWIGTPYCFGGDGNGCIDCSAYVKTVYSKSIGIELPRTAAEQYDALQIVKENDAQAGDLVFFKKNSKITHVGIYLGNNEFIHSSSSRGVIKQELNNSMTFAAFKRVL